MDIASEHPVLIPDHGRPQDQPDVRFSHPNIPKSVNLQEVKEEAKPYQIRQFLRLAERYNLKLEDDT